MIRIITFEREYGSGAADIARRLAERLGWKFWDQALTDEVARLMDCSSRTVEEREERRDPLTYRLFKAFMRGSFEGTLNTPRLNMVDADCIRQVSQRLVLSAAEEGNAVIVGRGAAYHLHDRPDALHVFVYAPFEEKVRRLERAGKRQKEAIELVETVDRDRSEYIKKYFDVEWPDRHFFHLMINSTIGEERVVETILHSKSILEKRAA
ncbi:MAG TPA: cytidylate kinase-like family protein [Bryobacteraceae bacterium]|jgi:cytidylate kinase|nr:cytidylate kinase-like family protein [Bryobacteraceae bacterium]